MDRHTADPIYRELLDALRLDPDLASERDLRERIANRLDQLTAALPQPIEWSVVSDENGAAALLLASRCLVSVRIDANTQDRTHRLVVTSRGLDPARDRVEFEFGDSTFNRQGAPGTRTEWTFGCQDDEFEVIGIISDEGELDRGENLARGIAAQLW